MQIAIIFNNNSHCHHTQENKTDIVAATHSLAIFQLHTTRQWLNVMVNLYDPTGVPKVLYLIYAEDNANSLEKRTTVRPAHLARLQLLRDEGRLIVAGALPAVDSNEPGVAGFSGSAIIAEFSSLEMAQCWANNDPYIAAGIYHKVTVKPFKRAF